MGILNKNKNKFYSLSEIDKREATYNIIIGERSNGKTFSCLERILENYLKRREQGAIIRRWDLDFKRGRGDAMFASLVSEGRLIETDYDGIEFKNGRWYLYRWDYDLQKKILDDEPFCYSFALSNMEHDKSTSYPRVTSIVFDEFLSRMTPLPDEFVLFMNCISTIIRHRDNVKIYMLGNTVNKSSIYFKEMGIKHIDTMQPGQIDVYKYGDSGLVVAVEYCNTFEKSKKKSDKYFAFDNEKLKMITGGAWELAIYPHLPMKYKPKDVRYKFFIIWEENILQCEVIRINSISFIYIHIKTTPIKDEDKDLIFSPTADPRKNWRRRINDCFDDKGRKIWQYFQEDRVYYQNNEVGEIVRNYLIYCKNFSIIKS